MAEVSPEQRARVVELVQRLIPEPEKMIYATNWTTLKIYVQEHSPIHMNPRRYSLKVLGADHECVDKLSEADIMEPSESPWCSPPVMARRSDGTYRLCIDYRQLNAVTRKRAHPIPPIDSMLDNMKNARYITKVDMSLAFHQVQVDPDSCDYTAFSVPGRGQFRYKRMSFGLTNAPTTYQDMMEKF